MKFLWINLFFIFPLVTFSQEKATIGMSIKEVKKIYPSTKSDSNENGKTLSRTDTLYNIEGEWGYRFKSGKMNWIFFSKYIKEINEANFEKCLSATRQLIKDYTNYYSKPDTIILGDTIFVDPYEKKHWGYNVMEARWKNHNGMKIKIDFTFLGGKGDYCFLVKINYFDKNYPYFD